MLEEKNLSTTKAIVVAAGASLQHATCKGFLPESLLSLSLQPRSSAVVSACSTAREPNDSDGGVEQATCTLMMLLTIARASLLPFSSIALTTSSTFLCRVGKRATGAWSATCAASRWGRDDSGWGRFVSSYYAAKVATRKL